MTPSESAFPGIDDAGRPTGLLPVGQLVRLSLYWLGLSAIFSGLTAILTGRLQFAELVPKGTEGLAYVQMTVLGSLIVAVVQPTVGSLSDYTVSRWTGASRTSSSVRSSTSSSCSGSRPRTRS